MAQLHADDKNSEHIPTLRDWQGDIFFRVAGTILTFQLTEIIHFIRFADLGILSNLEFNMKQPLALQVYHDFSAS